MVTNCISSGDYASAHVCLAGSFDFVACTCIERTCITSGYAATCCCHWSSSSNDATEAKVTAIHPSAYFRARYDVLYSAQWCDVDSAQRPSSH
eukprot:9283-Heterococcus_DN1.PRE.1